MMASNYPYNCPSFAQQHPVSSTRPPVDLVTYRHEDELVYVTPALDYDVSTIGVGRTHTYMLIQAYSKR